MRDEISIEIPTDADWPAMFGVDAAAFHQPVDETARDAYRAIADLPRLLLARREDEVVGLSGAYVRDLVVPGAVVPAAHITLVSVAATARRRGILTRFLTQLFDTALAAGEPIAVLWASEGRIYQRFGFGLAARQASVTIPTREVSLPGPPDAGRLREASPAMLRATLAGLYDEAYERHPGWSSRRSRHWDFLLTEFPQRRGDATALRAVVHEGPAGPDGYVLFRTRERWGDGGPEGEVRVRELVAHTPAATAALWRFILDIDLTRTVTATLGLDDPLHYLVDEPRRLTPIVHDSLWVRVLDVPAALAARRYAAPVDVVLEVTDPRLEANTGRWRLTGGPTGATCARTTDEPDLALGIRELGAAYLGGTSLAALAAAGLVHELRPGALSTFSWPVAPSTVEMF